ncbi:MAG: preprotein translocase subunit SecA, partial [Patescibacteria group bacterium]
MFSFIAKIFDFNRREINKTRAAVEQINSLEPEFKKLSDAKLKAKTEEFRSFLTSDIKPLDSILPAAFAAVREASRRTTGLRHYDVQLVAG